MAEHDGRAFACISPLGGWWRNVTWLASIAAGATLIAILTSFTLA